MPLDSLVERGDEPPALTVPSSAVSNGSVTVIEDGTTSRVQVTTGIVSATRTEIVDGLEDGAEVVLADLAADLPSGGSGGTAGPP